jgi:limonene-1,2-epoxide hydrolase
MDPKAIVDAFLAAMQRMDYDAALKLVSSDCEYTNLPMGTATGPEGIRETLEPFFGPIAENEFKLLRIAVEGDVVFVERLDRHRIGDIWFELPVTGVFEIRAGRIRVWREYFDLATLQRGLALGA